MTKYYQKRSCCSSFQDAPHFSGTFYNLSAYLLKAMICFSILLFPTVVLAIQNNQLAPPRYQTTDEFGINLTTGQVTASLDTVAIGGELGLSHSISGHTNHFAYQSDGYSDKYSGNARWVSLGVNVIIDGAMVNQASVLRIFAMGDTADFKVMRNGIQSNSSSLTSGYVYEALGDKRHTLKASSDNRFLLWTKPDGTEVTFIRATSPATSAGSNANFESIKYPNGFTITVNGASSVTSNTGFQLKYDYINDSRAIESSKAGRTFATGTNVPLANPSYWSAQNPKYIYAINNAVEYCSPTSKSPCSLSNSWPKATFNWPGGMPRALYIDKTIFSVTDMRGGITDFHFEAQDLALKDPSDPSKGYNTSPITFPNTKFSPRLVGIKPAGASSITRRYEYDNIIDIVSGNSFTETYSWTSTELGRIKTASGILGSYVYSKPQPIAAGASPVKARGSKLEVTSRQIYPTALSEIYSSGDGHIFFGPSYVNSVLSTHNFNGANKKYGYDSRSNLIRIQYFDGDTLLSEEKSGYPVTCSNAKTCNQPLWFEDGRGNRTDFTYHANSGQVSTITHPANASGLRAQVRYEYGQRYAYTKNASGARVRMNSPIWLKTAEKTCANTSSCAGGSDEIITAYEYNHDNLLLTGITVTSNGKTLRTCYTYDIYGNRIGETQPNANLSNCN